MSARIRFVLVLGVCFVARFSPETVRAEHYAVIFAGGVQQSDNHPRYYESVGNIHDAFMRHFNVMGENIFVLAADGTDPAPDIAGGGSSDWSFITSTGGTIEAATHDNMRDRLAALAAILQPRDTLIVWTYDHGGGAEGAPGVTGEENLSCWNVPGQSGDIRDDELAAWLAPIQADRQAYFFGQCFSGGMLDDLVSAGIVTNDGAGGLERFGCAAATHYETSVWSFGDDPHHYIDAVQVAIRDHDKTTTFDIEQWAYEHTHNAIGRGPGGTWQDGKQHPWRAGEDFELAVAHWYGTDLGNWSNPADWKAGKLPEVAGRPVRIAGPHVCNVVGGTHVTNLPLMITRDGGQIDIESGAVMEVYQMDHDGLLRVLDGEFRVTTLLHGGAAGEIQVFNDGMFHASWGRDYAGNVLVAGGSFNIMADYTGGGDTLTVHGGGSINVGQDMLLGGSTALDVSQTGTTVTIIRDMTLSGSVQVGSGGRLDVGDDCTLGANGDTDVQVDYGMIDVASQFDLRAGSLAMRGDPATSYLTAQTVRMGESGNVAVTFDGGRIQASTFHFAVGYGYDCDITMNESGWLQPQIVTGASGGYIEFGSNGKAHVVQNAGLVGAEETAANHPNLSLATGHWSTSTYQLNDGSIFVHHMTIGGAGNADFTQNGGNVEVFGLLSLGNTPTGVGVYNLRGGDLIVHGFADDSEGSGTINIDGGTLMLPGATVAVRNLNIGSTVGNPGEFFLGPRTLHCENLRVGVNAGGVLTAQFSHVNASGMIQVGVDHLTARIDQQGGAIAAPVVTIGVQDDGWGEWNMNGGSLTADTLTVGYQGWGQLNQYGGASVAADAVDVGYFSDTGNNVYTLDDGSLTVAGDLRLAVATAASGTFRLRGADDGDLVTTTNTCLGVAGEGRFEHSGGRHEVSNELRVGNGGDGRYVLTGGSLATARTLVGHFGGGIFDHRAGMHQTTTLYVGEFGEGEYNLSGTGDVSCLTLFVGHYDQGNLNQSRGNVHVTGDYFVGHSSATLSTASQTAGTSTVDGNLIVGMNADSLGAFVLGGDSVQGIRQTVAGNVTLGYYAGANGTYTLGGRGIYSAELRVGGNVTVGRDGTGEFVMAGGRVIGTGAGDMTVAAGSTLRGDGNLAIPVVNHGSIIADGAYSLQFQQSLLSHGEVQIEATSPYNRGRLELRAAAVFHGSVANDGYFHVLGGDDVHLNGGMSGSGDVTTGEGAFHVDSAMTAARLETHGTFHVADHVTVEQMFVHGTVYQTSGDTDLGQLRISMGRYELTGTTANLTTGPAGENIVGEFYQSAGSHAAVAIQLGGVAWYMERPGRYQTAGGRLEVDTLRIGAEIGEVMDPENWMPNMNPVVGTLAVTEAAADIHLNQSLVIASVGRIEAVEGATIHMNGSAFENKSTNPDAVGGLANLVLIFEGGAADVDLFEVSGEDRGAGTAGFIDNFVLGTLQLGGAAEGRIRLVDDYDNSLASASPEALYVENLILNPGANLDLNELNLYYRNGSSAKQFFLGDANLDGRVDAKDASVLAAHWGVAGTHWSLGDFDGNGVVDAADAIILAGNWGAVTVLVSESALASVPEPSAILLLATLALGGILRRARKTCR